MGCAEIRHAGEHHLGGSYDLLLVRHLFVTLPCYADHAQKRHHGLFGGDQDSLLIGFLPKISVGLVCKTEGRIYGHEHYHIVQHPMARLEVTAVILLRKLAYLLLHGREIADHGIGLESLVISRMIVIHRRQNYL